MLNMVKINYPILKPYAFKVHEDLAPVKFPNLYKVANARKRKVDSSFRYYQTCKDSLSKLPDHEVEEAVSKPMIKCMDQVMKIKPPLRLHTVLRKEIKFAMQLSTSGLDPSSLFM